MAPGVMKIHLAFQALSEGKEGTVIKANSHLHKKILSEFLVLIFLFTVNELKNLYQ